MPLVLALDVVVLLATWRRRMETPHGDAAVKQGRADVTPPGVSARRRKIVV